MRHRLAPLTLVLLVAAVPPSLACRASPGAAPKAPAIVAGAPVAPGLEVIDEETIAAGVHLVRDIPATSPDKNEINVVVEIPAGTSAKFEVDEVDGRLKWEIRDGRPRVIDYLPFPANYGFVPRTRSDADDGGDGDPLDVFVLGPPRPRGDVLRARLVGALIVVDAGERDDKLLAIPMDQQGPDVPFGEIDDLVPLRRGYRESLSILCAFVANYDRSREETGCQDAVSKEEARQLLNDGIAAYAGEGAGEQEASR